ncbi:glycerol-3-phosphate dehydrogenase, partial [Limosilactobacillus mucosae]|nr:glycerol-3-phosphate dehydrogenase [Limosilactobacillus mucosae]
WGSVLANLLVGNNQEVMLWSRDSEQVVTMNRWHINPQYMKDFKYSPDLKATDDMEEAVRGAEYILMVIPTKGLREVAGNLNQILVKLNQKPLLIHATKGLEQETYKRPSQMLAEEIDENHRQDIV